MTLPNPIEWLKAANVTAALLNTHVRDRFNDQHWLGSYQSADLVKTSDVTLENLAGMSFPVVSGDIWVFVAHLFYVSNTTADVKFAVTAPGGSTGRYGSAGPGEGLGAGSTTTFGTGLAAIVHNTTEACHAIAGYVVAGATGTVQIQGAQNTSNGSAATFRKYSIIAAFRVSPVGGTSPIPSFSTSQILDKDDLLAWISDPLNDLRLFQGALEEDVITQFETTPQDLPGLGFDVREGETWCWFSPIYFVSDSGADIAFAATVPRASVGRYGVFAPGAQAGASTDVLGATVDNAVGSTVEHSALFSGLVIAGADGKVQLQGCQANSDSVNTTFWEDSFVVALRLGVP